MKVIQEVILPWAIIMLVTFSSVMIVVVYLVVERNGRAVNIPAIVFHEDEYLDPPDNEADAVEMKVKT